MKVNHTQPISYFDADRSFEAKLSFLFEQLQLAAITHTEKAGFRMDSLLRNGQGWVLQKMELRIRYYPGYRDKVRVTTWCRGMKGARAKREFIAGTPEGRVLEASSVWAFVDPVRRRIIRIPRDMETAYTVHSEVALNADLDRWKADRKITPRIQEQITTRLSDYDAMGHVNNTAYIDFLETAILRSLGQKVEDLTIQYLQELPPGISTIQVGLQPGPDKTFFVITSDSGQHAAGEVTMKSPTPDRTPPSEP